MLEASNFLILLPCNSLTEVTATIMLQPSNMFMEGVGTIQACVVIAPVNATEISLTVNLRSLDGTASKETNSFSILTTLYGHYNTVYIILANPEDYRHSDPLQVTFGIGTTGASTECVDISIVEDSFAEGDHIFTMQIESASIPSPVVVIGTPEQQNATIQDNDGSCDFCTLFTTALYISHIL